MLNTTAGEIIRTVWTYRVDGRQMGTYTEAYAREAFQMMSDSGTVNAELVAFDHVASDYATTGRNWDVVTRIVATTMKSVGQLACEAAVKAAELNDPYAPAVVPGTYFNDASHLLLEAFTVAQGQGRLARVVAGFNRLAEDEGHRVHRLLISLKRGRTEDVLNALAEYELTSPYGGTLDGTEDEPCGGDAS